MITTVEIEVQVFIPLLTTHVYAWPLAPEVVIKSIPCLCATPRQTMAAPGMGRVKPG